MPSVTAILAMNGTAHEGVRTLAFGQVQPLPSTTSDGSEGRGSRMEAGTQELLWGLGILALPLVLALPMRLAWQFWVGVGHEVSEYRTIVRQIVDSGNQVASFSQNLDDIARN